jgi:putative ABC transport system permease protein
MSVTVQDPPLALGTGHGGMPARTAVARWAWRLFRREWRQQLIVLALLLIAVAAATIGLGVGASAPSQASTFGTADHLVTVSSTGTQLQADIAKLRSSFGTIDVTAHQTLPVRGSANGIDLRDQDPNGAYGRVMLRLDQGQWPHGPGEIAVTDRVARVLHLHVGAAWDAGGTRQTVVGLVENPLDLNDSFALVAPGQVTAPDHVDVLVKASQAEFTTKPLPDQTSIELRSGDDASTVMVLMLTTIALVFVGLLAVAGFTVMAQRRLRALGMLGAIGASHRHIRLVLLANGAVIGAVGALAGAAAGIAGWVVLSPQLESLLAHRIDRFTLPWVPLAVAVMLAIGTAVIAAWWPARAAARIPIVAALSARPAPPRPAHRFAAIGAALLAVGLFSLVKAEQTKPLFIIGGVLATAIALLLLAPVGVATIGRLAHFAPLASRLAMRDLARYRARSGVALAAIALAVGIAAVIALSSAVTVAKAAAPAGGNLPADQAIVWISSKAMSGPVQVLTPAQTSQLRQQVDAIAADLHGATVVPLTGAVDPTGPLERGGRTPTMLGQPRATNTNGRDGVVFTASGAVRLFVATPELLEHYRIAAATVAAGTDVLTPRQTLSGYEPFPGRFPPWQPVLQRVQLPSYTSLPNALITAHGMTALHLSAMPVGWLIDAPKVLTTAQIDKAQEAATAAGLTIETRPTGADQARLADEFTAAGIVLTLGVLAMTVGLIRSETARDLRTLTATGARRRTRRALTAATAFALALGGAVVGTACAYLAVLAWYHRELHWLAHPPVSNLLAILIGLPIVAYAGGWLLAGREAPAIARQPLD